MPVINILSPHVADMIAAGEVVERPASAVKELMENAFDAGARTVIVDIRAGGRAGIRITDDGCGMSAEDAGVCFLRHATSKLRDERGLEAIGTLGFRGEALAAISSVSRITMTTRQHGAPVGVRMEVAAGEIESMEETGCPEGTSILVRDLFFNTPARQKFLGSDRAEGAACVSAALVSALGHPEISVRCLRDGQEQFFSPGDGQARSAVYALLGRDAALGMKPLSTENEGVGITGFVSDPAHCRGNRSAQYFFVNGRPIRSRALSTALEQAYRNSAMIGKFPACVLYIALPNGLVDVNVHPTKAEVRFAKEKTVFDAVYYGTLSALGVRPPQTMTAEPAAAKTVAEAGVPTAKSEPKKDFFRSMDAKEFRESLSHWEKGGAPEKHPKAEPRSSAIRTPAAEKYPAPVKTAPKTLAAADPVPAPTLRESAEREERELIVRTFPEERLFPPTREEKPAEKEKAPAQPTLSEEFIEEPIRYIGEALRMYILLEQGDKLLLIDKHAAHERLLFDKMRLNEKPLMPQELLLPETLTTDAGGAETVEANGELLARLGFELESIGERDYVIRAVPAGIEPAAAAPLLEELIEKLREGRSLSAADVWERLAATVACKAAIKAGWETEPEELILLAKRVLSGEITHCPHGRPVMTVITRSELDKRFGRIV